MANNGKASIRDVSNLIRIMLAFGIDRIEILESTSNNIRAKVGWPDDGQPEYDAEEEIQEIDWCIQHFDYFNETLFLIEVLVDKGWLDNDRISVSAQQIFDAVNMPRETFDKAISNLTQIKIDMIDDGEKGDYFFFHF